MPTLANYIWAGTSTGPKKTMPTIKGAYNCSYCHGNTDNACTACDPECDCIELDNHRNGECDTNCQFCESENK